MGALTIGRVGTTAGELTVGGLSVSGRLVDLEVEVAGAAADAEATVEQLCGYAEDPDEQVLPVTWGAQSNRLDGIYRVRGVDAALMDRGPSQAVYRVRVGLERVRGGRAPLIESVLRGAKRTQCKAGVTATAWQAIPAAATGWDCVGLPTPGVSTLTTETGNLTEYTDPANFLHDAETSYYLPPAHWYDGAATIRVDGRVVVGREVPNRPTNWEISNGIVAVFARPGLGSVRLGAWIGGEDPWANKGVWQVGTYAAPATDFLLPAPHALTVLRNDPTCVAVRVTHDIGTAVTDGKLAVNVDYALRRGAQHAVVCVSSTAGYRWRMSTPVGASVVTGGGCVVDNSTGAALMEGNLDYLEPSTPRGWALPAAAQFAVCGIGCVTGIPTSFSAGNLGARFASDITELVGAVAR